MKTFFDILYYFTLFLIVGYPALMLLVVASEQKIARLLKDAEKYPKGVGVHH